MATIRTFAQVQAAAGIALLIPQLGATELTDVLLGAAGTIPATAPLDTFVFQYHPESLQDQQSVNYDATQIPGGSHPIYQWISMGARSISFSAQFTSDRVFPLPSLDVTNRYNVDINGVIAALRYLYYPLYNDTGSLRATPPKRLWLVLPGTLLGGFVPPVPVIMTDFSYTIEQWHAVGIPKIATVSLTFNEIRQTTGGGVRFVGRDTFQIPKLLYNPLAVAGRRAAL